MHALYWLVAAASFAGPPTLVDFDDPKRSSDWIVVNDDVMGGHSEGEALFPGGRLLFAGTTHTDGGGFASTRTRNLPLHLHDAKGLKIRVKGDGRTWYVDLRDHVMNGKRPFRASFDTIEDKWITVRIPFEAFEPWTLYGPITTGTLPELDPGDMHSLGFMIYDREEGPFSLEVDWVKAY